MQYLYRLPVVTSALRRAASNTGPFIIRVPSPIGNLLAHQLSAAGRPYAVEVVGDPEDVLAPGVVRHPLRPLLRAIASRQMRRTCANAVAASYVTERWLQRRYPCPGPNYSISSIRLSDEAFATEARSPGRRVEHLVFVGSLEQMYKGPDILMEAVRALVIEGHDLRLSIVGEGRHRRELEHSKSAQALGRRVQFLGWVDPGLKLREILDSADVFVLPSRAEGLPRALLEAMARGLPCCSTTVGGIPEVLPAESLVEPNSAADLAATLKSMIGDPNRLLRESQCNAATARRYSASVLGPRRREFYETVLRKATV